MGIPADTSLEAETPADFGTDPGAVAQRWISEIELAEKDHERWLALARKVVKRYRDDESEASADVKQRRFALLWSNMETLEPAVRGGAPAADQRRLPADRHRRHHARRRRPGRDRDGDPDQGQLGL